MAKLYFRYGAVGSAKTLNLLAVAHNYQQQNKRVLLLKPAMDVRYGREEIRSRAGLTREADLLIDSTTNLLAMDFSGVDCLLVDEAQFLSPYIIEQLREITLRDDLPAICYGLRTDFRTLLFPGSRRLFEIADSIEEVKSTCFYCNRKAIVNLKHVEGKASLSGEVVDLGAEEKYLPACYRCYRAQLAEEGIESAEEFLAAL